jgi:DNA-binding MarR family transcriptional regulator
MTEDNLTHNDEIDRVVEAWQRELPQLDVSPMLVLSRVSRLARHFERRRRAVFSADGLAPWEVDVLAELRRSAPSYELSPGDLAHATLSDSATMTSRIDRLADKGFVERYPDPDDRRGVRVRLCPNGFRAVERALADLMICEYEMLAALTPDQRTELGQLLRLILVVFDAQGRPKSPPIGPKLPATPSSVTPTPGI